MPAKIMMVAGEVSGDRHAAHLARAIAANDPTAKLYGTGGEQMRRAGVAIRAQSSHLGSVGLQESVRYVLPLRRVMSEIRAMTRDEPPDLAVLVDNEGFNGLVAKHLHGKGVPYVHFLPPQVWFWGRWRARDRHHPCLQGGGGDLCARRWAREVVWSSARRRRSGGT